MEQLRNLPMVEKPLILFDGECTLCNWAVNFVLERDKGEIFLFSPNQSHAGREILTKLGLGSVGDETVSLIEEDKIYSRSTAVLLVLRRLPFPWKLLSIFIIVPKSIRDFIYDVIAKNRYVWFGKMNFCRVPSQGERNRFLRENPRFGGPLFPISLGQPPLWHLARRQFRQCLGLVQRDINP